MVLLFDSVWKLVPILSAWTEINGLPRAVVSHYLLMGAGDALSRFYYLKERVYSRSVFLPEVRPIAVHEHIPDEMREPMFVAEAEPTVGHGMDEIPAPKATPAPPKSLSWTCWSSPVTKTPRLSLVQSASTGSAVSKRTLATVLSEQPGRCAMALGLSLSTANSLPIGGSASAHVFGGLQVVF